MLLWNVKKEEQNWNVGQAESNIDHNVIWVMRLDLGRGLAKLYFNSNLTYEYIWNEQDMTTAGSLHNRVHVYRHIYLP